MSAMKRLFQLMAEKKASDIFMSVKAPINIKINGLAVPVNQQVMDSATNLIWLINNTEAGSKMAQGNEKKDDGKPSAAPPPAAASPVSFSDFKPDVGEPEQTH